MTAKIPILLGALSIAPAIVVAIAEESLPPRRPQARMADATVVQQEVRPLDVPTLARVGTREVIVLPEVVVAFERRTASRPAKALREAVAPTCAAWRPLGAGTQTRPVGSASVRMCEGGVGDAPATAAPPPQIPAAAAALPRKPSAPAMEFVVDLGAPR